MTLADLAAALVRATPPSGNRPAQDRHRGRVPDATAHPGKRRVRWERCRSRRYGIGSSAAPARPIAGTVTRTERAPFQAVTLIEASGLLLVLGLVARAARNHRHF